MLGHLWDVVEDNFVWVARSVLGVLVTIECDGTDDSSLGVFEGGVAPEVRPLFLICVLFSHILLLLLYIYI